jgi:hypothetical protein
MISGAGRPSGKHTLPFRDDFLKTRVVSNFVTGVLLSRKRGVSSVYDSDAISKRKIDAIEEGMGR